MSKILMYRNDHSANVNRQMADEYGGIGYYRIVNPSKFIKGHTVDVVGVGLGRKGEGREEKWKRIFQEYDVFWTSYFADSQEAATMYYFRDKFKKKVIIDLDDDYLNILPTHSLYDTYKPQKRSRAFVSTILSFADVITVSTEPLKQVIGEHMDKVFGLKKKIHIIPNMNDLRDWNFSPAKKHKDKIVIGYSGSNSHYDDLKMVLPQVASIMDKYPNVHFESIGAIGKEHLHLFNCFSDNAKLRSDLLPSTWSFKEYPKHLSKQKWDIGIAPLADSAFTRGKSHIKWMEYAMYNIPTIASRVYPYFMQSFGIDTILHERTGILVKPSEWSNALEDLILHKDKRELIGKQANQFVKEHWQYNERFSDALGKMLEAL